MNCDVEPRQWKMNMGFGTRNDMSLIKSSSLKTIPSKLPKCKSDLVGVQEVSTTGGVEPAIIYFSMEMEIIITLETCFFVHKGIRVYDNNVMCMYIYISKRLCYIVLNVQAPTEDKVIIQRIDFMSY
jgi:hypothetical protein